MAMNPYSGKTYAEAIDHLVARFGAREALLFEGKRYSFADPMMRLWVRLHCRPTPPNDEDVVREVHRFVMSRIPAATEPAHAMALAGEPAAERDKSWGIIEID